MDIQPYLKLMVEKNASDLFFTINSPVKIKSKSNRGFETLVHLTKLTFDWL